MSKNLFLVLLILGCWIAIITVFKTKQMPKKDFKADEIIKNNSDDPPDNDKSNDKKLSPVDYYDQRYYVT